MTDTYDVVPDQTPNGQTKDRGMDHSYGHSYDDLHAGEWRGRKANTKRKRKQHVTAAVAPPPALDLTLRGTACRVTEDDALAENIERGFHLINYFEDRFIILSDDDESDDGCIEGGDVAMSTCATSTCSSTLANADETNGQNTRNHTDNRTRPRTLYMDRYDARMLIDDYTTLRRRGSRRTCSSHDLADCDATDMTLLELIGVRDREDGLSKQQIDEINFDRFGALPEYCGVFLDDGKNDCINNCGVDQEDAEKVDEQDEEPFKLTEEEVQCLPKDMVLVSSKMICSAIYIGTKVGYCTKSVVYCCSPDPSPSPPALRNLECSLRRSGRMASYSLRQSGRQIKHNSSYC